MLPKALENVIEALGALPGVGPRTAERYAYYLFKTNSKIFLTTLVPYIDICDIIFIFILF